MTLWGHAGPLCSGYNPSEGKGWGKEVRGRDEHTVNENSVSLGQVEAAVRSGAVVCREQEGIK